MKTLVREDKKKAGLLRDTGRFLGDLFTINDQGLFEGTHVTVNSS